MDLATIEATPEEATAKLDEYRAAVKLRHTEEDEAILRGYKELDKGRSLLRLTESFTRAGWDDKVLPRLAIARMIDDRVNVQVSNNDLTFNPADMGWWPRSHAGLNSGVVRLPIERPAGGSFQRASAIVPIVPPGLRPARAQHRHFVLFEAEWKTQPPRDPALIRHLVGDMWVVLAMWDLTEVERAAIAGR